jgi:hypothetical protein
MQPDPTHVNQFSTGGARGRYLCTAAAGAMALDAFTAGRIRVGAKDIDDRQDDSSGGVGLNDVATAWKRGWGLTFSHGPRSWAAVRARLAASDGVVLQGLYAVVPVIYRAQANFTRGHAIYAARLPRPGWVRVFDPIAKGATEWPEPVVRNFYLSGLALAGWGVGATTGPGAAPGERLGGWGDLISFPVGHIITAADITTILVTLQRAGWFDDEGPAAEVVALAQYRGVLERVALGRPWTKALQDELAAAAGSAASDPLGLAGVADTITRGLGQVATTAVILAAVLVITVAGLYLLARGE